MEIAKWVRPVLTGCVRYYGRFYPSKLQEELRTITEQLQVEVKASVLQRVRFKYACRHCERTALNTPIVTAPMPAQPLPGSVATPS
ncbi:hypothetical protein ACM43_09275, partial [Bradyrhizobium sp. CCBAU 45321]|nr:hypothetical protein [Bradyrhizobium sp. CCBAU 45321]